MDNIEKKRNSDNSKMTFLVFLLIILVIVIILFQYYIYITTKEKIECVEEKLGSISSAANSAVEIAELPIRRNIYSSITVEEVDDDTVCDILGIGEDEFEQIKSNLFKENEGITIGDLNFNSLKAYITNADEKYTNTIYEEFYNKSEDELFSKWYAYILSGVIKYHLDGEITSIKLEIMAPFNIDGKIIVDNDYNITISNILKGGISFDMDYKGNTNLSKSHSYDMIKHRDISRYYNWSNDYEKSDVSGKPIIYIYPTQEQNISVKLGNPELLTCSYPQYEDGGWDVLAKPNGDLLDLKTGKNLYSLYWEGISNKVYDYSNTPELEGFVVKGEDTTKFLEEKLSILGLSEREKEEFIIYWLPQMEDNKYNYIRFETIEEIEKEMPLQIEPKPDTTIRVLMDWKKLDEAIEVKEQELIPVERNGYTVVEWGASVLNENIVR